MKSILILVSMSLSTMSLAADLKEQAVQAFLESTSVQNEISHVKSSSFGLENGEIQVVSLGGGCGFAGCDNTFLVVQLLESTGANSQVTNVSAIVEFPAVGSFKIKLAEILPKTDARSAE
jgi:hypothetical protein